MWNEESEPRLLPPRPPDSPVACGPVNCTRKKPRRNFFLGMQISQCAGSASKTSRTTGTPSDRERNSQDSLEYSMKLSTRPGAASPLTPCWHRWVHGVCRSKCLTRWWLEGHHALGERRLGPGKRSHHVRLPGFQIAGRQSRVRVRKYYLGSGCSWRHRRHRPWDDVARQQCSRRSR